jgi:hypothetical protein
VLVRAVRLFSHAFTEDPPRSTPAENRMRAGAQASGPDPEARVLTVQRYAMYWPRFPSISNVRSFPQPSYTAAAESMSFLCFCSEARLGAESLPDIGSAV